VTLEMRCVGCQTAATISESYTRVKDLSSKSNQDQKGAVTTNKDGEERLERSWSGRGQVVHFKSLIACASFCVQTSRTGSTDVRIWEYEWTTRNMSSGPYSDTFRHVDTVTILS